MSLRMSRQQTPLWPLIEGSGNDLRAKSAGISLPTARQPALLIKSLQKELLKACRRCLLLPSRKGRGRKGGRQCKGNYCIPMALMEDCTETLLAYSGVKSLNQPLGHC